MVLNNSPIILHVRIYGNTPGTVSCWPNGVCYYMNAVDYYISVLKIQYLPVTVIWTTIIKTLTLQLS